MALLLTTATRVSLEKLTCQVNFYVNPRAVGILNDTTLINFCGRSLTKISIIFTKLMIVVKFIQLTLNLRKISNFLTISKKINSDSAGVKHHVINAQFVVDEIFLFYYEKI